MIVATGNAWIKHGFRSIGILASELADQAKHSASLTLYTAGYSAETTTDLLVRMLDRGVKVDVVVDHLKKQPDFLRATMRELLMKYPKLSVYDFAGEQEESLHAKIFAIDRSKAIVGSSNLTWKGTRANYEVAFYVEGKEAESADEMIRILTKSNLVSIVSRRNS